MMSEAYVLTWRGGSILITCYDWRIVALWGGYSDMPALAPETVALGAPLVIELVERTRLWRFLRRVQQSGGAVSIYRRRMGASEVMGNLNTIVSKPAGRNAGKVRRKRRRAA